VTRCFLPVCAASESAIGLYGYSNTFEVFNVVKMQRLKEESSPDTNPIGAFLGASKNDFHAAIDKRTVQSRIVLLSLLFGKSQRCCCKCAGGRSHAVANRNHGAFTDGIATGITSCCQSPEHVFVRHIIRIHVPWIVTVTVERLLSAKFIGRSQAPGRIISLVTPSDSLLL
jgi:hypothetical protein